MINEYPFVIGTAGHIDHGKTALVRVLTGVDCDRLGEEKRRGMTIEPGFAPLLLPSGKTVSIIDVPGHEKFIRQMTAGAAGTDAVMLVIAADDGVMPQTREHLEILSLLGITEGIAVINKIDLVESDILDMAEEDVRELLEGTFLEGRPIIRASSVTKEGVQEILSEIDKMVSQGANRSREGRFFMPVDRAFHVPGFGTVVTGTPVRGELAEGAEVSVMPSDIRTKIRSIEVHGERADRAMAGRRTALSLAGVSLEEVRRGDAVAAPGFYSSSDCLDVLVEVPASFETSIGHWQRLRLHAGTSDTVARVALLDRKKVKPGEKVAAQLLTEDPITAYAGERFILRTYSPLRTIAGGEIVLAAGGRPKGRHEKKMLSSLILGMASEDGMRERLLALTDYKGILTFAEAEKLLETERKDLNPHIAALSAKGEVGAVSFPDALLMSKAKRDELKSALAALLASFHSEHPERSGIELENALKAVGLSGELSVEGLAGILAKDGDFAVEGERVRKSDFTPFNDEGFEKKIRLLKELARKAGYAMPTLREAAEYIGADEKEMRRVTGYLKEMKAASLIAGEFLLFSELEEDFRSKLAAVDGDITLGALRDATKSSRKYILPLLEHFDSKGITRRVGDKRILLKK